MSVCLSPHILTFLAGLSENNTKVWFEAHRDEYRHAQQNFLVFVESVIAGIGEWYERIAELIAKKCMFRIHRDTRFSTDKRPYKRNMGAWFSPGHRRDEMAGYYIHLQPGNCFLAGGVHMMSSSRRNAIRRKISTHASTFKKIVDSPRFSRECTFFGEKLKTFPRGFSPDDPMIEYLRYTEFSVIKKIPDDSIVSDSFLRDALRWYTVIRPFNDFFNDIPES